VKRGGMTFDAIVVLEDLFPSMAAGKNNSTKEAGLN